MAGTTVLLAACVAARPIRTLTPELLERGASLGFDAHLVEAGRADFVHACGVCHAHPDPVEIPAEGWDPVLERMFAKSGTTAPRRATIRAFVLTLASAR
jgi:hypothetical protein